MKLLMTLMGLPHSLQSLAMTIELGFPSLLGYPVNLGQSHLLKRR